MSQIFIHTASITGRLRYTAELIFSNILGLEPVLTADKEEFLRSEGFRLNYSRENIPDVLQVIPHELLFEKRINDRQVSVTKDDLPKLFPNSGPLGFDPLAASFYLVTRYEEYLPHRSDPHGRFPAKESLAYQNGFLRKPIVEHYAKMLAEELGYEWNPKAQLEVSFDIDQSYAYKHKGWLRTALGAARQLTSLDFKGLRLRYRSMLDAEQDPLDLYEHLNHISHNKQQRPIFFLQVGENTRYDINNPSYHLGFQDLVFQLEQEAEIGLHPSYYTSVNEDMMRMEVDRLNNVASRMVTKSRQHYLRFQWPSTFTRLQEQGITDEYSIGYSDLNGFRSGISKPYRFYNLERDEPGDLTLHPFCFMDMAAIRQSASHKDLESDAMELWEEVQSVGGVMCTVWHLETLAGHGYDPASLPILESLLGAS